MLKHLLITILILIPGTCIADDCNQDWRPAMDVLTLRSVDNDKIFVDFITVLKAKLETDFEEASENFMSGSDLSFEMDHIPSLTASAVSDHNDTADQRIMHYRDKEDRAQSYMNDNGASQMLAFQRATDDTVSSVVFLGSYKGDIPDHVVPVFTDRQNANAITSYGNQYTVALEMSRQGHACDRDESRLLDFIEERLALLPEHDETVKIFLRTYQAAVQQARTTP